MWTRICSVLVTSGLLLAIASDRAGRLAGDEPKPPTTIRADEVGRSVSVLGKLGFPLRSVVSVSGIWVELTEGPSKPGSSLWFRVVEVSGKQLDKPVEFRGLDLEVLGKNGKAVEPAKGEQWELRAYETWPDYGHPSAFVEELGHQPGAPAPRGPTRLVGILKQRTAK
jgi:hypothetical protein